MKTTTRKYYRLVSDLLGGEIPNGYHCENFTSKKAAKEIWKAEYRDRKKNDGNDAYWNKVPFMLQRVTETVINYF